MNKYLVAILAGVVVGILIAPEKGAASRARLSEKLDDLAHTLLGKKKTDMYQNALDTIGEHIGVAEKA